jgi:GTP cyclohydrolase II
MQRQVKARLPTPQGNFDLIAYSDSSEEPMPHLAFVREGTDVTTATLVRVHSECLTGDIFGSKRCDCGEQLTTALAKIGEEGGVLIYLRQEGRGIGLINKLRAYNLQDEGMDTAEANTHLGFEIDARQYDVALAILQDLGIKKINLLTNNPLKVSALEKAGITIAQRVPLVMPSQAENERYFETKRTLMGHFF